MEKVKALKETIAVFVKEVEGIKDITDSLELDAAERKAVRALQLAEVQVAEAGDDLYRAAMEQRRAINAGLVVKKEETKDGAGDNTEGKGSKPRKTQRKTKKSAK